MMAMATMATNPLITACSDFLNTGRYSDITVVCHDENSKTKWEFKLHRLILDAHSPVLRKALTGNFKEGQVGNKTLKVHDEFPCFKALVAHMYGSGFAEVFDMYDKLEMGAATFAVQMYAIADKYEVKSLQEDAATRFQWILHPEEEVDEFMDAMRMIDKSTAPNDTTLLKIAVQKIKDDISTLLEYPAFEELLREMPTLNRMLLAELATPDSQPQGIHSPFMYPYYSAHNAPQPRTPWLGMPHPPSYTAPTPPRPPPMPPWAARPPGLGSGGR